MGGILMTLAALSLCLAGCGAAKTATTMAPITRQQTRTDPDSEYTVVPSAAASVRLETYECADFSMTIPSAWQVETGGSGMFYSIRVYDPSEPLNQMFVLNKADLLLHGEDGKQAWQSLADMGESSAAIFAAAPVLYNPSTEGFFQQFSEYASFASAVESSYAGFEFPAFDAFSVTEKFPSTSSLSSVALGDNLLRASFSAGGRAGEGMFAASVVDFGSFAISDGSASGYALNTVDGGYYSAYNIVAVTAAEGSLIDWEGVLTGCMATLEFSDSFVSATNQASNEQVAACAKISQNFNEAMDGIMSSWEARSTSQDIMSQKQSDATLGFERVYNTETGEVYQATSGFTDTYDGTLLAPVTDDSMYAQPVAGRIERLD
uniref:hypothetical protein n=1 Tax=Parolsenella massiliensis TaxID=1871022 RepID=UPI0012FEE839|nr:hypothetical protein [Parolsenella massiliensis]